MQGREAVGLEKAGINTITKLASSELESIPDAPYLKGEENKDRAILQAQSYLTGELHQQHPVSLPEGNWVHFDIEDNPLTEKVPYASLYKQYKTLTTNLWKLVEFHQITFIGGEIKWIVFMNSKDKPAQVLKIKKVQ